MAVGPHTHRDWGNGNSQEIKSKCAALLEAVGEVPQMVEQFLQRVEADLADQKAKRRCVRADDG